MDRIAHARIAGASRRTRLCSLSLVAIVAVAPHLARADQVCQNRKTGGIVMRPACTGKWQPIPFLNDLSQRVDALEAATTDGGAQLDQINTQIGQGLAAITALQARFPVSTTDLGANAVDASKVQDGSLGLAELGVPLVLPRPAAQAGANERLTSAVLDLDDQITDADGVDVEQGGDWLTLALIDTGESAIELEVASGVFDGAPRCVGGLTETGSPDQAQNLEVKLIADDRIRVRVVGTGRELDVHGTLLCMGAAAASP
jgi:hypothetical protein